MVKLFIGLLLACLLTTVGCGSSADNSEDKNEENSADGGNNPGALEKTVETLTGVDKIKKGEEMKEKLREIDDKNRRLYEEFEETEEE